MINLDQLKAALSLHRVKRFQTHHLNEPMSVAEHSFRVACIYDYLGGTEIVPTLTHDLEEAITGDVPGPAKREGLVTVSEDIKDKYCLIFEKEEEKKLAKLADILDVVIHIREQAKFSDRLSDIYETELERVLDMARELRKTREVKKILKEVK